jgi:hypothetical protein
MTPEEWTEREHRNDVRRLAELDQQLAEARAVQSIPATVLYGAGLFCCCICCHPDMGGDAMSLLLCLFLQADIFAATEPETVVVKSGDQEVVLQKTDNPRRFSFSAKSHAEPDTSSLYVVMFTASYCGPCRGYKDSGQMAELQSQIAVTICDVQRGGSRWHGGSIPCFWICDKRTRKPLKKFEPGIVKPSELMAAVRELNRRN